MKTFPDESLKNQTFLKKLTVYLKNGVALSGNIFATLFCSMAKRL